MSKSTVNIRGPDGQLKMWDVKICHNEKLRGGECNKGKCGTILQGWKMCDTKMKDNYERGGKSGTSFYGQPLTYYDWICPSTFYTVLINAWVHATEIAMRSYFELHMSLLTCIYCMLSRQAQQTNSSSDQECRTKNASISKLAWRYMFNCSLWKYANISNKQKI